jgi:hypothetical protein
VLIARIVIILAILGKIFLKYFPIITIEVSMFNDYVLYML